MEVGLYILGIIVLGFAYKELTKDKKKAVKPETVLQPAPAKDTRTKLIIDTDASPKSDPDDCQTWVSIKPHVMNEFNLLGFVGSSIYGVGSVGYIRTLLNETGTPNTVPVVQGALKQMDVNTVSAGAQFYIDQLEAMEAGDKLEIHIWGSCSTLAQALKSRPELANRITTVYWVANGNRVADEQPYNYLRNNHTADFALYRDEQAFRGMMRSGDTSKLTALHQYILKSNIGNVWNKYTAELVKKQPAFRVQGWKNGDLTCYLFSINHGLRDRVFKRDTGKWFVAEGNAAEQAMAADNVRNWKSDRIRANVDLY